METGNDAVDGGDGSDQLEFGGDETLEGAGLGADDIRGGPGSDRLSYLDHSGAVRVSLDGRAGDGTAGEGDNAHTDIETLVGSTLDDVLSGNDGAEQLFGNAGLDRLDGLGGADTALVDSLDVVAQDSRHGCERIDRTAAGAVLGVTAFNPQLRVIGVRRLKALARGKYRLEVTCPGSCRVRARFISGRSVVASRTKTQLGGGVVLLRPKTNERGRKLLKRRTRVGMTLAVDVTDDQGQVLTLARVLTFRR